MKSKVLLVLFAVALLFGCSSDPSETMESESLVSDTTLKGPERPFKITGSGTFEAVAPDGSCYLPLQIALDGGGRATHLGTFSAELTWCFQPPTGPLSIVGTVIAANGDEVYLETVGQGIGENGEVYELFVFTGGTGRFVDVSGAFELYTTTEIDPNCNFCGTYSNYGEGSIRY